MKDKLIYRVALSLLAVFASVSASAQVTVPGTYKTITIDGSFGDWAGVPLAYTAAEGSTNAIEYDNIYIANDANNLYIRCTLYAPRPNAFQDSYDNIFIDADDNSGTGFPVAGIGSEMLIQWGGGYDEQTGGFNSGAVNNLGWAVAGSADSTDFELSISLGATYAPTGAMVFSNSTMAILLEGDEDNYTSVEYAPPDGGLVYTLASPPGTLTTNLALIGLTNSSWEVNASATDLSTNWLATNYDDTQPGWSSGPGLFGYTPVPSDYPPLNTSLTAGPNTYYFRTHFQFTNDTANIAFVVTNYLSDGAVYYINGTEVNSIRMPVGTVTYATAATGTNSPVGQADVFGFNGAVLQSGDNIMDVEAHQAPGSSADMVFGLSLTAAAHYPAYNVDPTQPDDQTVVAGQPVTFTSDIIGSGPLSYQWYFGTNAIVGATGLTYTIPTVLTNYAGTYSLVVSNGFSSVTSRSAILTVSNTPVVITAEPVNTAAVIGLPTALSVSVTGTPVVLYQWYINSTNIPGATNATFAISSVASSNAGTYYVSVSNPANTTNSTAVVLTVLPNTIPPAITNISTTVTQVIVTFSKPIDPVTGTIAGDYSISGGIGVTSAALNPGNSAQVVLTTGTAMNFGTLYSLSVNGVKDIFGNTAHIAAQFSRDITIDGAFSDWIGLAPIYTNSAPSGNTDAADFEAVYVYNDASYYYFMVALWTDIDPAYGQFPYYVNMFFDTDNNPETGYSAIGSEMLIQSGYSYQEKDGGFNDGYSINGLDFLCLPASPGTNFEFQISRSATFVDTTPVFTTNIFQFLWQGMTPGFVVENTIPAQGGTIGYTNITPPTAAALPLSKIAIFPMSGSNIAVVWDQPGTLQSTTNLAAASWTTLSSAASPYVIPTSGTTQFFRLTQ